MYSLRHTICNLCSLQIIHDNQVAQKLKIIHKVSKVAVQIIFWRCPKTFVNIFPVLLLVVFFNTQSLQSSMFPFIIPYYTSHFISYQSIKFFLHQCRHVFAFIFFYSHCLPFPILSLSLSLPASDCPMQGRLARWQCWPEKGWHSGAGPPPAALTFLPDFDGAFEKRCVEGKSCHVSLPPERYNSSYWSARLYEYRYSRTKLQRQMVIAQAGYNNVYSSRKLFYATI